MPIAFGRLPSTLTVLSCLLLAPSVVFASDKTAIGVVMPWYGDAEDWHHWAAMGHDPSKIIDGKRDIASAHYPLMGPYKSRSDATEQWHLDFAKAMGMDVLLVDYYTQNLAGKSSFYDFTVNLLDKAEGGGIKVAVQYEPKVHTQNWVRQYNDDRAAIVEAVKNDLRHIHDVLAAKPAYWRVDNKPVVQIFGQMWTLTETEWKDVLTTLNNEGRALYYIGDAVPNGNDYAGWFSGFQSHLNWSLYYQSIAGNQGWDANYGFAHDVNDTPLKWSAAASGRQAVGVAWPGFDDSAVDGWGAGARVVDRADGEFYRASLAVLNDLNYDWRVFTTLNDWNEGTELEPSREFGYQYALATLKHIEAWKGIDLDDDGPQEVTERHFPQLVALRDHADDLGLLDAHDAIAIDNANSQYFNGDGARFFRNGQMTASSIQYQLAEGIKTFRVTAWFVAGEAVTDFRFHSSPDGVAWTQLTPAKTEKDGDDWTQCHYENADPIPAGHQHVKIEWPTTTGQWWSPQIGQVKLYQAD